jgi:hypothetical protein
MAKQTRRHEDKQYLVYLPNELFYNGNDRERAIKVCLERDALMTIIVRGTEDAENISITHYGGMGGELHKGGDINLRGFPLQALREFL